MKASRPIDKSKKSNRKCEHCKSWGGWSQPQCIKKGCETRYYNVCKDFEWNPKLPYKE